MTQAANPIGSLSEKRLPVVSLDRMQTILIRNMAQRFKDVNPEVATRIDAAAAQITGLPFATHIVSDHDPALNKQTRPTLYLESEAGQGKTTIVRAAFKRFCQIAGLNFVENPPEHYIPTKQDGYFFTANMIAQHNTSEVGGLPVKITLGGGRSEASLVNEFVGRLDALARMFRADPKERRWEHGGLDCVTVEIDFDKPGIARFAHKTVRDWLMETLDVSGGRLALLDEGDAPDESRFAFKADVHEDGKLALTYFEPKAQIREMSAMGKLPNIAWAKASQAGCTVAFFDEVDKLTPAVRHLLLEIAQKGCVSGTANLGSRFMVVMAGNLGDRGDVNDFNESISQPTVAETTRTMRYRVVVTPDEWAAHIESLHPGSDNAHFPSFIRLFGDQKGIFSPDYEDSQFEPSMPCANARSLEMAMDAIKGLNQVADQARVSRELMMPDIEETALATIGAVAADSYVAHVHEMQTLAVPLADHILQSKDEKSKTILGRQVKFAEGVERNLLEIMNEKTDGFSFINPQAQDFAHRFQSALANATVRAFIDAGDDNAKRCDVLAKGIAGLGMLKPEVVNAGMSLMFSRVRALLDEDSDLLIDLASDAISRALRSGMYGDSNKSAEENQELLRATRKDMIYMVTGTMIDAEQPERPGMAA